MRSWQPLRPGDLVGIIAPSGPFPAERYERGRRLLLDRGYRIRELLPGEPRPYLAAGDRERASAFDAAFADPEIRAIFAARGGYGAMRILPSIDWAAAVESGKPLVGFSDATALHLSLLAHGGHGIHGPVVTQLGEQPIESVERLFALLESPKPPAPIPGRTIVEGSAKGRLVGGCLSLVSRLIGTPYLPDLDGCILLLEDVGEKPYSLDRMWTHLGLAGLLDGVAGFALGDFTDCDDAAKEIQGGRVMEELVSKTGKPVLAGLPIGHGQVNLAVPLGAMVEISDGALRFVDEG